MTARLAVAGFLFALALSLDVYFAGVERALNKELERVGPGRAVLTHFAFGEALLTLDGTLGPRLKALDSYGHSVYLKRVPKQADVELVGNAVVLTYEDLQLSGLRQFFPQVGGSDAFLLLDQPNIPEGARLRVEVGRLETTARVLQTPASLLGGIGARGAVLMPASWAEPLEGGGFVEIVLFESRSRDFANIAEEVSRLKRWLELDRFSGVNLKTGFEILERLEQLRAQQALWSILVRSVVATLVVLVFSACAFLEYRENAYLSALLRSMGVPRAFLFLSYAVEHAILLLIGFLVAAHVIDLVLPSVTALRSVAESSPGELFAPAEALSTWWLVLLATAMVSLAPVLFGLRREIGKTLQ